MAGTLCVVLSASFPSPHICLHYSCAWKYPFLLLVSRSCVRMCAQSCLTLCNPMDYSPPGCSVHGISQARILEWTAISSFRGSSQKGLNLCLFASPALAGRFFTTWATGEASRWPPVRIQQGWNLAITVYWRNIQDSGSCLFSSLPEKCPDAFSPCVWLLLHLYPEK